MPYTSTGSRPRSRSPLGTNAQGQNDQNGRNDDESRTPEDWLIPRSDVMSLDCAAVREALNSNNVCVKLELTGRITNPQAYAPSARRNITQLSQRSPARERNGLNSPPGLRFDPLLGRSVSFEEMVAEHAAQDRPADETYWTSLHPVPGKVVANINEVEVIVNILSDGAALVREMDRGIQPAQNVLPCLFAFISKAIVRHGTHELVSAPVETSSSQRLFGVFAKMESSTSQGGLAVLTGREMSEMASQMQQPRYALEHFRPRLSTPPPGVDCFLANTVFKTPHGLKSVQELRLGDGVTLTDGTVANVVHATEHERSSCRLVEIVTNQAKLKVSENHRIMVVQGPSTEAVAREARTLSSGEQIMVGTRPAQLAAIRHSIETVSLFNIQLNPDGVVEAYVLPNYGIHVRAVEPNLLAQFEQVPADELMAAMASQYHD